MMDPVSLSERSLTKHFGLNHAGMQQFRQEIQQQQADRSIATFMAEVGLGAFADAVIQGYGVHTFEDLIGTGHLSDDELVNGCGMTAQDATKFRNAVALMAECSRDMQQFRRRDWARLRRVLADF